MEIQLEWKSINIGRLHQEMKAAFGDIFIWIATAGPAQPIRCLFADGAKIDQDRVKAILAMHDGKEDPPQVEFTVVERLQQIEKRLDKLEEKA